MDSLAEKESEILQNADIPDIELQETSLDIWEGKYCLKSKEGLQIDKSIEDTYKRVARSLAKVEAKETQDIWYEKFLWALRQGVIPAGRIISNAGANEHKPATSHYKLHSLWNYRRLHGRHLIQKC